MSREMIDPWRQYGVKLEKEEMVDGVPHLFISVPTVSDFIDDNGNELSGALLAKRVTCHTTSTANQRVTQKAITKAQIETVM